MNQVPRSLPRARTLAEACREIATPDEWRFQHVADQLGADALLREWSDDFDSYTTGTPIVACNDRPFADLVAAESYLQARSLQRQLVLRALTWLERHYWVPLARRHQEVSDEAVSYNLLASLRLEIASDGFAVEGREYQSLRFRPPGADTFAQLVELIATIATRMDPVCDIAEDFQREVQTATGRLYPDTTILDAMKQAGLDQAYFRPGRRPGRPAKSNA